VLLHSVHCISWASVVPKGQGLPVHVQVIWGHLKIKFSQFTTPSPPQNLEDLRCRIVNVDVLRNTPGVVNSFQEMRWRTELCVQWGGGQVEGNGHMKFS
jgi:hypothetical protein